MIYARACVCGTHHYKQELSTHTTLNLLYPDEHLVYPTHDSSQTGMRYETPFKAAQGDQDYAPLQHNALIVLWSESRLSRRRTC